MRRQKPSFGWVFLFQHDSSTALRWTTPKPDLGLYGELTVAQALSLAQNWLAEVRRSGNPDATKIQAREVFFRTLRIGRLILDAASATLPPPASACCSSCAGTTTANTVTAHCARPPQRHTGLNAELLDQ